MLMYVYLLGEKELFSLTSLSNVESTILDQWINGSEDHYVTFSKADNSVYVVNHWMMYMLKIPKEHMAGYYFGRVGVVRGGVVEVVLNHLWTISYRSRRIYIPSFSKHWQMVYWLKIYFSNPYVIDIRSMLVALL